MFREIEKVNIETGLLALAHNLRKKQPKKAVFSIVENLAIHLNISDQKI